MGRGSGGVALLNHRLRAGMPPASVLAVSLGAVAQRFWIAEGADLTGEFPEAREGGSCSVRMAEKGPMVEFQLPLLG